MPPPGLQIYVRPYVTLTFDLLNPKDERLVPLPYLFTYVCMLSRLI